MGRNGQELCIISNSIIRFVGKFWHLEVISSEYCKIFIFCIFNRPWIVMPKVSRDFATYYMFFPQGLGKNKKWCASVGIIQKSILKIQFWTFLPFRGKTAKISRTHNFQTTQDQPKKFTRMFLGSFLTFHVNFNKIGGGRFLRVSGS